MMVMMKRGNGKVEGECGSYDTYYGQFEGEGIKFPLENPTHQGSDAPWLPPGDTLHMYGMHTPNNKELHNEHRQYTLRTFVQRRATVSCTGSYGMVYHPGGLSGCGQYTVGIKLSGLCGWINGRRICSHGNHRCCCTWKYGI